VIQRWIVIEDLALTATDSWASDLSRWASGLVEHCVDALVLGNPTINGQSLDPFVVLASLQPVPGLKLGALCELDGERFASLCVRETTTIDLLNPAGAVLILRSTETARLEEGMTVAWALFHDERATAGGAHEHVEDAPNLPAAKTPGGVPTIGWDSSTDHVALGDGSPVWLKHGGTVHSLIDGATDDDGIAVLVISKPTTLATLTQEIS